MLIDRDEPANARIVRALRAHDPLQREQLVLEPVEQQRAVRVRRAGELDEARVALREIDVVERARELRRLELQDLQMLRVRHDVARRRAVIGARLQRDQARALQQQQTAPAVDGIVRDRDRRAVLQLIEALDLLRIQADLHDRARRDRDEVVAALLLRVLEERDVLKIVDVDVLVRERRVRRVPVGELDDLHVEALRLRLLRGHLQRIDLRARRDADLQRRGIGVRERHGELREHGKRKGGGGRARRAPQEARKEKTRLHRRALFRMPKRMRPACRRNCLHLRFCAAARPLRFEMNCDR
ncbi:hypothetical protein DO72_5008 [Burkholderia pseudomallei]|nr:hypothetical protein DO73_4450 [Burkholderia pseudomallei]KGD25249.1 hypothetical protein DP42_5177 [Burkholderia pseudomallei]KGD42951.1 hypothetical protein DO72_5008 [Burkholderia pseudomallei]KGD50988.1 hypothetical protein DP43_5011 [Burkholderia pseudomallei]KGD58087.1 hypothetical protein DP49_5016 [Burkholderia pseudomallei]